MTLDRGHLLTEQRNPRSAHIDRADVSEAFDIIHAEDRTVAEAVAAVRNEVCATVELVVTALRSGGRLVYVGAGTSGRLGVIDAAECPPTFMTPPGLVQGIIAGGPQAMLRSMEGAEDDAEAGAQAVRDTKVGERDVVMGIASGGTTPFVHAALAEARRRGARTVFLACVPREQHPDDADVSIRLLTGPEVITGSTRMKAGTATKMVLNMITTLSMIQLGKVFSNLMVDLNREACTKLQDRAIRIVQAATGRTRGDAADLLSAAGDVKTAIVMHFRKVDRSAAERLLADADGLLKKVVELPK